MTRWRSSRLLPETRTASPWICDLTFGNSSRISFVIFLAFSSVSPRRSLSLKIFDWGKVEEAGGNKVRQRIGLRRGLSEEIAKKITKLIRDEFPKVKSQIQGDAVRVSGKSRDDLQRVIARLRELDLAVPLQFENYR